MALCLERFIFIWFSSPKKSWNTSRLNDTIIVCWCCCCFKIEWSLAVRIDSIKNFLANRKHILIMYIVLSRALSGHGFCNMFKNDDLYYSSVQKQSKFINGFLNTITISCLVTNWCHWKRLEFWVIKENWFSIILSNHFLYFINSHSIQM